MSPDKVSKTECIDALLTAEKRIGHDPSIREYKNLDIRPSHITIIKRFGSWNKAKKKANQNTEPPSSEKYDSNPPDNLNFSKDEWLKLKTARRCALRKKSKIGKIKTEAGCSNCGYDKNPAALDFHHVSDDKYKSVSKLVNTGMSMDVIENEISKCQLLCANCHREAEDETYLVDL